MPQPRHFTQQKFRKTRHVKNRITQCFHELLTLLHADATKSQRCIKHNKNQHWQKRSQKKRITYKKQLEAKSNKKKTAQDHVPKNPTLQDPTPPNPKPKKTINLLIHLFPILKTAPIQNTPPDKIPKNLNPIILQKKHEDLSNTSPKSKHHINTYSGKRKFDKFKKNCKIFLTHFNNQNIPPINIPQNT